MRNILGNVVSIILGFLYAIFSGVLGMIVGPLFEALIILSLVSFFIILIISLLFSPKKIWPYPLLFSLPAIVVSFSGALSMESFLSIGIAALVSGLAASYFVFFKRKKHLA